MCGIIACLAHGGPAPGRELLARMNALHARRGPDSRAVVECDGGRLGLAHTRLAVIDLSREADQPMTDEGGRRWLVFNGEIYNHRELRARLEALGERFRTRSDTEVLLRALMRWGQDALERLEGMFAFVYADLDAGWLLAARDRMGIKPLYWTSRDGLTCFSSTLAPLTLLPGFPGRVDPVARFEMLVSKYVCAPRSIYEGVAKLEPGALVRVDFSGAVSRRRWWTQRSWTGPGPDSGAPRRDWRAELEAALDQAVERQLVADVPVGVFLSGGVDSSLVAALAARRAPGVRTFSIGFREARWDESAHARAVARHLGTRHSEYILAPRDVERTFQALVRAFDEPFGDASALALHVLCREARRDVTVALSGDGGDEQFFGYARYRQLAGIQPLVRLAPAWLRRLALALAGGAPRSRLGHALAAGLGFPAPRDQYTHFVLENFALLAELCGAGPREALWATGLAEANRRGMDLAGGRLGPGMMLADQMHYLPDDCLTKTDRVSMDNSLEVRVPLLDEAVLRTSLPMPLALKFSRGRTKAVLRDILAAHLPPGLAERPKMGFGVPLDTWLFDGLEGLRGRLLSRGALEGAGLDPDGVARVLAAHRAGRVDHQYFLWPVLCYVAWASQRAGGAP